MPRTHRLQFQPSTLSALIFSFLLVACDSRQLTGVTVDAQTLVLRQELRLLEEDYMRFRKSQIANPVYHLDIDINAGSSTFDGMATLTFELAAGNAAPVTVDFDSGSILELSVNGSPADYQYEQWFITIPAQAFQDGSNVVSIRYQRPFATDGAGLHKFTDPEDGAEYFYTNFEPYDANRLFPHFDQPNLKAPLTLEVTVPADWQVITNTMEIELTAVEGRNHWVFPATPPLSSYVYALHTGPYAGWVGNAGGIPLRLFARKSLAPYVAPEEWFAPTQQSFAFFQDWFEMAYPFGKYDQVIVPDFNAGAMENVAAVTFNERYVSRGVKSTAQLRGLASVIAHEMAHMWFGDLVTMDWWNGLWLNESFATYMANLELERASPFQNVWDSFYTGNKLWAYDTDQLITTHPIELDVATTADAFTNFDGITYGKGGSVLKQLPYFIGEENFRVGVRNYLMKYAYMNTTLDDFVNELAIASGMDLSWWKQEWLYRSGVNTLEADFTCEAGNLTSLRLLQHVPSETTADKDLRSQRTQVGLYRYNDEGMQLTSALPVTYGGAVTWVPAAIGQPCPDLVLPNEGDWAYMKIKLDNRSFATLTQRINDFANPTTRLMLWQSLWDSVQDGSLSLLQYMDFALANSGAEQDDNVLRHVTGTLASAFNYFSRFGGQDAAKARMEDFLFGQLLEAQPGSELQKVWYDSFTGRAHTPAALAYLQALLEGSETLEGLLIDQDKRWGLVVALNRYQHDGHVALASAELARDPSDQGSNMALVAEAVRPEQGVKAKWFDTIVNAPDSYKLATLRSVMAWLFPAEQSNLLAPYREPILAAIPQLDALATQEYLSEFTGSFSGASCTPESVARLAQANADFAGMQPLVVKSYLIHHQNDQRCVRLKSVLQ